MRTVFGTMGTVASVDVRGGRERAGLGAAQVAFETWEAEFSLFDPASPLSAVARGELALADSGDWIRDVYTIALDWRRRTDGAFTPHRPDGVIDLDGVVKALALADAGDALDAAGIDDWCLNVGGDVLVRGRDGDRPWTAGVVDPDDRDRLLTAIPLDGSRRAIATSGRSERGDHIWTRHASADVRQATVVADDIVTADVLATALVAGADVDEVTERFGVDVLVAAGDGLRASAPFRAG